MTENNPPADGDVQPTQAPGAYPPPDAYPPPTAYPPPDAYPPGGFSQPNSGPQPAAWPQPGAPWPNQAPPYGAPQFSAPQQPSYPPQQPVYPGQQPSYPTTPYGTPPAQKPQRTGLVILLGVLGLCVVLVAAGLLLRPGTTPAPGQPGSSVSSGGSGATTAPTAAASSASDAVQGYLDALVAGDAEKALGYAAAAPQDASLLTNDVLAAGNAIAPITDITVEPTTGSGSAVVEAQYTIGGEGVTDTFFNVVETASGWKLEKVAAELGVGTVPAFATINGTAIPPGTTLALFPGSYQIGTSDERYRASGTFVVHSVNDDPWTLKVPATLSSSGVAAVRSAAQKRLNACIKENKMHPSDGCGFWIRSEDENGKKFTPKKVRWHITSGANTLKTVKLSLAASDATVATGKTKVKLYLRVDATNGRWYWATVTIASLRAILGDGSVEVRFNE